MEYVVGFILGVVFSVLIVATLGFFRSAIERRMIVIEKKLMEAGPQPRGSIIMPTEEADEIREEIIARNRKEGRDTKFEELI